MALTETPQPELGSKAHDFALKGVDGQTHTRASCAGENGLLVMFICNHCPFVVHVRDEFSRLMEDFRGEGLRIIAINSNDLAGYPQDGPTPMRSLALELGWSFPYCFDEDQSVARSFFAACTPDFFLVDRGARLVYRGQLDGSRPGNGIPVTGADLRGAIEAVLAGRPALSHQIPSLGCNIKWTPSL